MLRCTGVQGRCCEVAEAPVLSLLFSHAQERFEEVKGMLQPFLKLSGFKESLTAWLPAVGPTGENLVGPPAEPQLASWWRGPSVVQAIDAMKPGTYDVDKPLRLPVTDVFKGARGSAALGGRLVAGALKVFHLFTRVDAGRPCGCPAEYLHTPGKPCCKASIMTGNAADLSQENAVGAACTGDILRHQSYEQCMCACHTDFRPVSCEGCLQAGTKVVMQPGNHAGAVRSVEVNGAPVPLAIAGDTVDVALNGIDAAAVSAGSMLCHPQWLVPLVSRFEARVVVLDIAMPILKGRQVGAQAQLPQSS